MVPCFVTHVLEPGLLRDRLALRGSRVISQLRRDPGVPHEIHYLADLCLPGPGNLLCGRSRAIPIRLRARAQAAFEIPAASLARASFTLALGDRRALLTAHALVGWAAALAGRSAVAHLLSDAWIRAEWLRGFRWCFGWRFRRNESFARDRSPRLRADLRRFIRAELSHRAPGDFARLERSWRASFCFPAGRGPRGVNRRALAHPL